MPHGLQVRAAFILPLSLSNAMKSKPSDHSAHISSQSSSPQPSGIITLLTKVKRIIEYTSCQCHHTFLRKQDIYPLEAPAYQTAPNSLSSLPTLFTSVADTEKTTLLPSSIYIRIKKQPQTLCLFFPSALSCTNFTLAYYHQLSVSLCISNYWQLA